MNSDLYILQQIFNALEELAIAAKYPHVRTFLVALNQSETELTDLIQVELPWSVPTASESRSYLLKSYLRTLKCAAKCDGLGYIKLQLRCCESIYRTNK